MARLTATLAPFLVALLAAAPAAQADGVWEGAVTLATGPGTKGPWQQNDSRYDYVDDPAVAFGPGGELALAWVHQGEKDVFFRRADGNVVNVSRTPETFSWLPRLAFAPHDPRRIYVLWQEIIFSGGSHGGDILFARSEDGGASFGAPRNLSRSAGGDGKGRIGKAAWDNGSLDLAVDADGSVVAAWTDYEGALYLSISTDGAIFSTPRRIAGDARRPARGPSVALGLHRTLYVAWAVGEDLSAGVQVARSTDGGASFSAPVAVGAGGPFSDAPKLVLDDRGVLHLAFAQADRVAYSRSTDGARSFEPARAISAEGAGFPSIGVDRDGNICVTWERIEHRRSVGLGFAVSRDHGRSFGPPAPVPGSDAPRNASMGSQQGLLADKLATAPDGALALVTSALEPGKGSRVWLIRGSL